MDFNIIILNCKYTNCKYNIYTKVQYTCAIITNYYLRVYIGLPLKIFCFLKLFSNPPLCTALM